MLKGGLRCSSCGREFPATQAGRCPFCLRKSSVEIVEAKGSWSKAKIALGMLLLLSLVGGLGYFFLLGELDLQQPKAMVPSLPEPEASWSEHIAAQAKGAAIQLDEASAMGRLSSLLQEAYGRNHLFSPNTTSARPLLRAEQFDLQVFEALRQGEELFLSPVEVSLLLGGVLASNELAYHWAFLFGADLNHEIPAPVLQQGGKLWAIDPRSGKVHSVLKGDLVTESCVWAAYHQHSGQAALERGEGSLAQQANTRALELCPKLKSARLLSLRLEESELPRQAIGLDHPLAFSRACRAESRLCLELLVELYPRVSSYCVELGDLQRQEGETSAALASYEEAMRRDPHAIGAFLGRAMLRVESDPQGALDDLQMAQRLGATPQEVAQLKEHLGLSKADLGH